MIGNDLAREIRQSFRDPRALCAALGLKHDPKHRSQRGVTVSCPIHAERSPSCSVTNGPDGTVRFKCFGCDATGDALTLIAAVRSLRLRGQFREVLAVACELGGLWSQLAQLQGGAPELRRPVAPKAEHPPAAEREYPDPRMLSDLWDDSTAVSGDKLAVGELERRNLDARSVALSDLARVIPPSGLPPWARYQGKNWNETGHRMIVRAFDADGVFRSVRAWRTNQCDSPKRLPPAGCKASGLVLANGAALRMLRGEPSATTVVVTEGEPDWLVRSMLNRAFSVIGIGSGSWHKGFADRVPYGCEVIVRTHRDAAGEAYALKVLESVRSRAQVYRLTKGEPEAE